MTPLRQRMIDDLRIRNYSRCTIDNYLHMVAQFAKHLGAPPSGSVPSRFATTSCICSRTTPRGGCSTRRWRHFVFCTA